LIDEEVACVAVLFLLRIPVPYQLGGFAMSKIEDIEMSRYAKELEDDMQHLLEKYCRIMGWNVPELDETKARALILGSMQDALQKIQSL
jgi:hypothetical protein